jgi:DNA gyrase/topoisomerase IV subunit A
MNEQRPGRSEALASEVIEDSMREYAEYTLIEQLPNPVDGLKLVHRRILWAMRGSDKVYKMPNIIGKVIQVHPHGDMSIADSMYGLMQPFTNIHPLIASDSNVGSYAGDSPAAPRYMDISRADFAFDMYFKDTNAKVYDYVKTELGDGWEPRYLIPKIPMALLTATFGLPVGFKVSIHPYGINNVFKMTKAFAENPTQSAAALLRKNPEWLYPDSFLPSLIRNTPQLNENIRNNVFSSMTVYDGTMDVGSRTITIKSLPFGVAPGNVYETMYMAIRNKNDKLSKYIQSVDDYSKGACSYYLVFTLKRGVDPFKVLDLIKQRVKFTATHHPFMRWVSTEGKLLEYDVDQILEHWYEARYRSLLSELKHKQTRCVQGVRQCEARCVVAENVDEVVKLFRTADSKDEIVNVLMDRYNLSRMQSEYLTTMSLISIQKSTREEILKEMESFKNDLRNLKQEFASIPEKIVSSTTVLEAKYSAEKQAKTPHFRGVLKTKNGFVQFWNESEQHALLLEHGQENSEVQFYPKGRLYKYMVKDSKLVDESILTLPKEDSASKLIVSRHKLHSTIVLMGDAMLRRNELVSSQPKSQINRMVGDRFSCVTKEDRFEIRNTTSVPLMRSVSSRGAPCDVRYVSHTVSDSPMVIVHVNTKEVNTLRFDIVEHGSKVDRLVIGKWKVLGLFALDEPFIVNIPNTYLSRNKTHQLFVPDILSVMAGETNLRVYMGRSKPCQTGKIVKSKHGMLQLVSK